MQEIFYEETSLCANASTQKKIYYAYLALAWLFIVLSFVWVFILLYTYDFGKIGEGNVLLNILVIALPFIATIGFSILFLVLRNRHCLDYDYTFVSGSIRISKIIKEVKRRAVCKFEASQIEKIGKVGSRDYNALIDLKNVKLIIATSNKTETDEKNFYYMLVSGIEEKKVLIILECTETFIKTVLKFANRYVLEKDFK